MNRTTLSLIAAATSLAAVTGFAMLTAPDGAKDDSARPAARLPVERTSLLCPAPSSSDVADTSYTSYTPVSQGTRTGGTARVLPADGDRQTGGKGGKQAAKPVLAPKAPGKPVDGSTSNADAPALVGTADGSLAPGWTVQQSTTVAAGAGRGLLGLSCTQPDTDFWFPGVSTAHDRADYVHLTNPDDSAAVVDIELYGKDGALKSDVGDGIQVKPHASVAVLLSTLAGQPQTDLTAHVTVRSGRVGAAVQASDDKLGGDWLPASAEPAGGLVLPGIPKDATSVRLVAFAPGDNDADLKVRLASPTGAITPAGHESLHVKSGMTTSVDLGDVTRGEAGSLLLTPTGDPAPVVAALEVVRGKGSARDIAFIPATAPVGARATVADNRGKDATLSLVAPSSTGTVKVTASAGTGGGSPVTKTYTVKGGTTTEVRPPVPGGLKGAYALTVEQLSGGPVYGARTLTRPQEGVPMFTVQTLSDDRGTVSVPKAGQDLSVLQK
ncbi:DUF5719 family protein [Streptomyces sp. NPDC002004]